MKKKLFLLMIMMLMLTIALAITATAAEWFGEVEYLDGIDVSNHIKAPVTEENPELGEPTTAARAKVSCTCAKGEHTFPAYYIAYKDNSNTEMWYFTFADVNAKLTCGGEEMGLKNLIAYEFPNGITSIGCTLYYECKEMNLKFLSFERAKTLTKMGDTWAGKNWFANAPIEEIKVGPYLTKIASFFCYGCTSLKTLDFGENSKITTIGGYAFYKSALTEVILPDTLSHLAEAAFKESKSIGAFYIPASLTQFGINSNSNNSPIDNCENLYFINDKNDTSKPEVYYFPKSITAIIGEAFKGCKNLNDVLVFHEDITYLGNGWAFCNSNAISIVFLGDMQEVCTPSNQAWNNGITIYYCNKNDISANDITSNAKCNKVYCYAEGNTSHKKELSKETEASCEMPKMSADYCFCGQYIVGSEVTEGMPLGHNYAGDVSYEFTSLTVAGTKYTVCTNDCGKPKAEALGAVYTALGYSVKTFGTTYSFVSGYDVNVESLALYEAAKGTKLQFGFAFNAVSTFTDGDVTLDSFKIVAPVAGSVGDTVFSFYQYQMKYPSSENLDAEIIIAAYVIEKSEDAETLTFINRADGEVNGFDSVSYVKALELAK